MLYKNVYFYIESGYKWGSGMSEESYKVFLEEIKNILEKDGWEIKEPYGYKGKNNLFIHPMEISCDIQEDMIENMETLLTNGKSFKLRYVKVFASLEDLSDNEYITWLESKKEEIEKDLLNGFCTKRKNLFISMNWKVIENVKEKYHKARLGKHIGRSSSDIEWKYVNDLFLKMVEGGKFDMAETRGGTGYRTKVLTKGE